jgi:hypothetical protein
MNSIKQLRITDYSLLYELAWPAGPEHPCLEQEFLNC